MQNMAAADGCNWQQWSREDVAQWLESLSLGKYRQVRLRCLLIYLSVSLCGYGATWRVRTLAAYHTCTFAPALVLTARHTPSPLRSARVWLCMFGDYDGGAPSFRENAQVFIDNEISGGKQACVQARHVYCFVFDLERDDMG